MRYTSRCSFKSCDPSALLGMWVPVLLSRVCHSALHRASPCIVASSVLTARHACRELSRQKASGGLRRHDSSVRLSDVLGASSVSLMLYFRAACRLSTDGADLHSASRPREHEGAPTAGAGGRLRVPCEDRRRVLRLVGAVHERHRPHIMGSTEERRRQRVHRGNGVLEHYCGCRNRHSAAGG